jgi:uncharacterized protein (DUF2336 family)
MTVIASPDLIARLDHVLKAGSPDLRTRMLQEVAGLFLEDAHRLSEHHVQMFDGILVRLTESIELRTRTTLSRSLADLRLVPRELARRLANHDDADVAAPILRKRDCIPEGLPLSNAQRTIRFGSLSDLTAKLSRAAQVP